MRGETVKVFSRVQDGVDELNNPIWLTEDYDIENVLVSPGTSQDVPESTRPDGVTVKYTLYIPKTFDGKLDHCTVDVRGELLDVVGSPRRFDLTNCPTEWWMVAEVGTTNG